MASNLELAFPENCVPASNDFVFPLFPLLPGEIQIKIWQSLIPTNQVIKLYKLPGSRSWMYRNPGIGSEPSEDVLGNTAYRTPVVLQICHQSRKEGLKVLRKLPFWHNGSHPCIFFNYESGTIRLMWHEAPYLSRESALRDIISSFEAYGLCRPAESLRYLSVDYCFQGEHTSKYFYQELARAVAEMPHFKRLTLINHRHVDYDDEESVARSCYHKCAQIRLLARLGDQMQTVKKLGHEFEIVAFDPLHEVLLKEEEEEWRAQEISKEMGRVRTNTAELGAAEVQPEEQPEEQEAGHSNEEEGEEEQLNGLTQAIESLDVYDDDYGSMGETDYDSDSNTNSDSDSE